MGLERFSRTFFQEINKIFIITFGDHGKDQNFKHLHLQSLVWIMCSIILSTISNSNFLEDSVIIFYYLENIKE
jgi:hypothetical protein